MSVADLQRVIDAVDASGTWDGLPCLRVISAEAKRGGVGRYGLLGAALPRAACLVQPWVRIADPDGSTGPDAGVGLSFTTVLYAPAEGGKGRVLRLARRLIPLPPTVGLTGSGTGEGLLKNFAKMVEETGDDGTTVKRPSWFHRSVCATVPEVTATNAELSRTGSKLGSVLCAAWMGEDLMNDPADLARQVKLPPHSYRLGLTPCAQPEHAGPILAAADSGLTQRAFGVPVWIESLPTASELDALPPRAEIDPVSGTVFPAVEWPRRETPDSIGGGDPAAHFITWPPAAVDAYRAHWAGKIGLQDWSATASDPLAQGRDGHRLLHQLKVAVLLAVLDGEAEPKDTHWIAAGNLMEVRAATMRAAAAVAEVAEGVADERDGRRAGRRRHHATAEADRLGDRGQLVQGRALDKLQQAGGSIALSDFRDRFSKTDRAAFAPAMKALAESQLVSLSVAAGGGGIFSLTPAGASFLAAQTGPGGLYSRNSRGQLEMA